MLFGRYDQTAEQEGPEFVFSGLRERFLSSDAVVGNMDGLLGNTGAPRKDKLCLRGDPRCALAASGVCVLSLANNHCPDYGEAGLEETRHHLDDAGVMTLGAGRDLEQATAPSVVEAQGVRLGCLA